MIMQFSSTLMQLQLFEGRLGDDAACTSYFLVERHEYLKDVICLMNDQISVRP